MDYRLLDLQVHRIITGRNELLPSEIALEREMLTDWSVTTGMEASSDRREQIQWAAMRVFARKGYRNTVVDDVAEEAGVSKGTIYTYFDRKEELLQAVFQGLVQEFEGREKEMLESDRPPLEKIRIMLHDFIGLFAGREELGRVMLDIWVAGMRDPDRFGINFADVYAEYRALLSGLLQEAQTRGEVPDDLPTITPAVLVGAIDGVFLQWLLDPESIDFHNGGDDIVDVLFRGIRGAGPS